MRVLMTAALAVLAFLIATPMTRAQATNLAYWDFNDRDGGAITATDRAELFSVDGGLHSATAAMSSTFFFEDGTTAGGSKTGITAFSGTTLNGNIPGVGSVPAGEALALQGAFGNNGSFLQFSVSTAGFDTIKVSYATRGSATGFNADQFQFSTDGVTFTNMGSAFDPRGSTFGTEQFDLAPTPGIADNPNAAFRIVFNGATSDLGNNRIDNLQINGLAIGRAASAPEPGTLGLLGIGLLGMARVRRRTRTAARPSWPGGCARWKRCELSGVGGRTKRHPKKTRTMMAAEAKP